MITKIFRRLASLPSLKAKKTLKENGIPVFIVQNRHMMQNDLTLTMQEFGVKAKDNEAYKWMYGLGYNEKEDGSREWVLYWQQQYAG